MDAAFLLDDVACSNFLQFSLQSFDCTYICLWSYLPLPRICLFFKDGLIREDNSPASMLFNEYRKYHFDVQNDRVPGVAFKNSIPYMELKQLDLQRYASIDVQRKFYQEAKIESAIFIGCQNGEIELGFSTITQMNIDMKIKNRFMQDFLLHLVNAAIPQQSTKQNHQLEISPSSSYISDEVLHGERQSFDDPNTCYEQMLVIRPISSTTNFPSQHRQSMQQQQVGPFQDYQLPSPLVIEDFEMTRPVVIISPTSSSSSTSLQFHQNLLLDNYGMINQETRATKFSAFKKFRSVLAAGSQVPRPNNIQGHRMFKRAISYLKSINLRRIHERNWQGNPPKINQLHHMISERRRREKLNDHFEALRSLLPLGSKKDKASVLKKTKEYLTSLQAQVSELSQRNRDLEARVSPMSVDNSSKENGSSGDEKATADFCLSCESTSKDGVEEIKLTVGGDYQMMDLTIRALEVLKRDKNVRLISMEAETLMAESSSKSIVLGLKIEGGEWDESAFEEALKRTC